jgi:hypothetical protein
VVVVTCKGVLYCKLCVLTIDECFLLCAHYPPIYEENSNDKYQPMFHSISINLVGASQLSLAGTNMCIHKLDKSWLVEIV